MFHTSHRTSKQKNFWAGLCAPAFVFFLAYSAPHRVHHFFDQVNTTSHGHTDDHHGHPKPAGKPAQDPDCVFQASASRCVFGPTGHIQPLALTLIVHDVPIFFDGAANKQFFAGVFQIRAPPGT